MAKSFEDYYERFEKMLPITFPMAKQIVKNYHDAEDILQEVSITLSQRFTEIDFEAIDGWIFMAVRNRACSRYKQIEHRQQHILLSNLEDNLIEEILAYNPLTGLEEEEEVRKKLNAFLHRLPSDARILIEYRLNGLKFIEIAEITGKSINTVKSRIRRNLDKFKHYYKQNVLLDKFG